MGCFTTKILEFSDDQKKIIEANDIKNERITNERISNERIASERIANERIASERIANESNGNENKINKDSEIRKKDDIEEKKRKENEKNLFIKLHILIKNLEVKRLNPFDINEKLKNLFDSLLENIERFKVEVMIEKVSNIFIDYLKPINMENSESIRNIMYLLYEKDKNPNIFSQYLFEALDKFNDYSRLGEEKENKIDDYITRNLNQNTNIQNKKNELKKKYEKNNYIIKYKDFTQIVNDFKIEMDNLVIEYLLYKMKCGIPLDKTYSLDNLNFNIFLDFLDKSNKIDISESNILKESVLDNKIEQIGIVYKNNS